MGKLPPIETAPELAPAAEPVPQPSATLALLAVASALGIGGVLAGPQGALVSLGGLALAGLGLFGLPRLAFAVRPWTLARRPIADFISEIYDDANIGFAITDSNGKILSANRSLADMLGATGPGGIAGTRIIDFFQSADRTALDHAIAHVGSRASPMRELRITSHLRPDQGMVVTVGFVRRFNRLFLYVRDATFQVRLEAQVRQATKMQAVGQLAGGLAHDFNNILTAIIGGADLLLMREAPGSQSYQDVEQIRQNANRAANLVRQLLAFSRQQTLQSRVLKVNEIIGELSQLLRRLLGEKVRLKVIHGRALPPVKVDPGQIEQVIVNLIVNARDAMPDGGEVTIATSAIKASEVLALGHEMMPAADYVVITVRDSGAGIPADIIDNIFEPFFTTKEIGKGTGLGLSMVYGIVKQTGGYIFVSSPPGEGAKFSIYLPASTEAVVPVREAAPKPLGDWGRGTVLLVEDEAMVRAVAERALVRSGYEVLAADSGERALEILNGGQRIDLLISDVVMPGMDGPTLVSRVRADRPKLKVLYISGYAEEQIRDRVDGVGTALLRKPFSVSELSNAVQRRLSD